MSTRAKFFKILSDNLKRQHINKSVSSPSFKSNSTVLSSNTYSIVQCTNTVATLKHRMSSHLSHTSQCRFFSSRVSCGLPQRLLSLPDYRLVRTNVPTGRFPFTFYSIYMSTFWMFPCFCFYMFFLRETLHYQTLNSINQLQSLVFHY